MDAKDVLINSSVLFYFMSGDEVSRFVIVVRAARTEFNSKVDRESSKKISEMPSSLGESLLDEGSSVAKVSSLSKIRNSAAKQ